MVREQRGEGDLLDKSSIACIHAALGLITPHTTWHLPHFIGRRLDSDRLSAQPLCCTPSKHCPTRDHAWNAAFQRSAIAFYSEYLSNTNRTTTALTIPFWEAHSKLRLRLRMPKHNSAQQPRQHTASRAVLQSLSLIQNVHSRTYTTSLQYLHPVPTPMRHPSNFKMP